MYVASWAIVLPESSDDKSTDQHMQMLRLVYTDAIYTQQNQVFLWWGLYQSRAYFK